MKKQRKSYSSDLKVKVALAAIKGLQTSNQIATLYGVHPNQVTQWAQESFRLAVEQAYRNGTMQGGPDKDNGELLPTDYVTTTKPLAERRITVAGYRLADTLRSIVPTATPAPIRANKRSRIYHLPTCPGYDQISAINRVSFRTEAEARRARYRKAANCP